MSKVKLDTSHRDNGVYEHECPGCGHRHSIHVGVPNHCDAQWQFNGDMNNPTFSPSINYRTGQYAKNAGKDLKYYQEINIGSVCHYFIREGKIQYLSDCTHSMAGQTIDLPEIE